MASDERDPGGRAAGRGRRTERGPRAALTLQDIHGGRNTIGNVYHGGYTHTTYVQSADALPLLAGTISKERIAAVAREYAPGPRHGHARQVLDEQRVAVLRGQPGTGRTTAAIRLLSEATDREIFRLPETAAPMDELARHSGPGGFVLPLAKDGEPLTRTTLEALGALLHERDQYAVIVTDYGVRLSDVPSVAWEPAAPEVVLGRHLRLRLGDDTYHRHGQGLLQLPETEAFLDSPPRPRDCREYATMLACHHHGTVPRSALAAYAIRTDRRRVADALGNSHVSLWDKAFLIALAFLGPAPYPLLVECGDQLAELLYAKERGRPEPRGTLFDPDRLPRLLGLAHAELIPAEGTQWEGHPRELVAFRDPDDVLHVLSQLWFEHPVVRGPLKEWLGGLVPLGENPAVPFHLLDPAETALMDGLGVLTALDLRGVARPMLVDWAGSENESTAAVAANALGLAVGGDQARGTQVLELLREFPERGSHYRWAALITLQWFDGTRHGEVLDLLEPLIWPEEHEPDEDGAVTEASLHGTAGYVLSELGVTADPEGVAAIVARVHEWVTHPEARRQEVAVEVLCRAHACTLDDYPDAEPLLFEVLLDADLPFPERTRREARAIWHKALYDRTNEPHLITALAATLRYPRARDQVARLVPDRPDRVRLATVLDALTAADPALEEHAAPLRAALAAAPDPTGGTP
ncbi:hypothetical protein [Streptomyces purpureus]|uniref:hypothetical protein n=1 Tax=Streptomyces purpureus TaxID=1951 RepID=UPI0003650146|nr:hypothetical protein [Streptomyces purpureus]